MISTFITGRNQMLSEQPETVSKPDYNVMPVQLSQEEFAQFILPHLSYPSADHSARSVITSPSTIFSKCSTPACSGRNCRLTRGQMANLKSTTPESSSCL